MRKILFRAKQFDGVWAYGSLLCYGDGATFICVDSEDPDILNKRAVISGTVGQYTGLTDKNGVKIFEGDICRTVSDGIAGVVQFGTYVNPFGGTEDRFNLGFYLDWIGERYKAFLRKELGFWATRVEIIGNIHDNPELLEVKNETDL